jgi:amidase
VVNNQQVELGGDHGVRLCPDWSSNAIPEADSTHVARLRAAGAIPLIRTNMPDLGIRWHTDNALFGATVNPWDAGRTPGGSSGGEAAAIATGMTPFGVGNDYGGSVRLPAYANGVRAQADARPHPGLEAGLRRCPVHRAGVRRRGPAGAERR